uniref:Short/branched chain specific acyl-CoA dehydrogenase, mitochondrial n=1 Tax=Caenorhabditis tropicalis TaxID=1561998 RepID=A0A1I7TD14_9PELO
MAFVSRALRLSRYPRVTTISSASFSKKRGDDVAPHPLQMLSEQENLFVETVRRFAGDVIKPLVREMDENSEMNEKVIRGCFDNGLMGMIVPEKYGGQSSTFFEEVLVIEELAKVDAAVSAMVDVHNTLFVPLILELGTDEQKEKYLPKSVTSSVGSFALSEVSAGSDAFALKTVAKKDGDDFEDKLGIRASSTCPLFFENVRVHKSAILGEYGKGYKYAIECLNAGRIGIGAQMLGLAQGCFDQTIPYLQQREQFGQRLIDFQGIQHQIAQVRTEIEAARLLVYNAARMKEQGLSYVGEAAMAKLFASQVRD